MPRLLLSIVAPCFNEELVIRRFYADVKAVLEGLTHLDHEIVLVDDGSEDGTLKAIEELALEDPCVRPVGLPENRGQAQALKAGLSAARGDGIVAMDCDLQHPPELIPAMVERWEGGDAVVSMVRTDTEGQSLRKRVCSYLFYALHNLLSETRLEASAPDFCLLSRAACDTVDLDARHFFLRGAVARTGMRRSFLEFEAPPRAAGGTKYNLSKMLVLARDSFLSDPGAIPRLLRFAGTGLSLLALLLFAILGVGSLSGAFDAPLWGPLTLLVGGVVMIERGRQSSSEERQAHPLLLGGTIALIAVTGLWSMVASLPFFSETYIHLELGAELTGPFAMFATALGPFRPLQWGFFQVLAASGLDEPEIGRALTYSLHLVNALLVLMLVRGFGGSRRACILALLLFLAFPSAKSLVWIDAISGPARATFMLAGMLLMQRHLSKSCLAAGLGSVVALVLALGFHQSAIILPVLYLGLAWIMRPTTGLRFLRNPWLLSSIAICAVFAFYVAFVREGRHNGLKEPAAVLANGVRASLVYAPEWLRVLGVEGLRGHAGATGYLIGGTVVLLVTSLALALFRWAGPLARILLLGAAMDLVLPVLSVGFVLRYAYFGSALIAIAVGVSIQARLEQPVRLRIALAGSLALVASWSFDHVVDVLEYREAGHVVELILDQAGDARAAAANDDRIVVVNAPGMWGAEDDMPVFNWGLRMAIRQRGVSGEWGMIRSFESMTGTDHVYLDDQQLKQFLERKKQPVVVFDRARKECTWRLP